MLTGVQLPEYGSPAETAMLFMQKRKNNIETLRYNLTNKAILMANLEPEEYNKALKGFNELSYTLHKEINREVGQETKSFITTATRLLNKVRGKSVKSILKADEVKLKRVKNSEDVIKDFNEKSKMKNWSKI